MTEKSKTQHLRRLATRAGLRIATLATPYGRIFAIADRKCIVALVVGHSVAAQQLRSRAIGALQVGAA